MNNYFDMKIVELKYSNGVVGDPYAEGLYHSVSTLNSYMKDCFNWIGCKSSKKGRYIQLTIPLPSGNVRCKSSKKGRYIQLSDLRSD